MKPEWKNAPDWAMYRAMDEDENWCCMKKNLLRASRILCHSKGQNGNYRD